MYLSLYLSEHSTSVEDIEKFAEDIKQRVVCTT